MDCNALWTKIKNQFRQNMSWVTYESWVKPVKPVKLARHQLILELPSPLHKDYWQHKLYKTLVEYAYQITETDVVPKFVLKEDLQRKQKQLSAQPVQPKPFFSSRSRLNPNYTFEKFVIGKGNQMAQAAALVASDDPGKMYNPLLIYGGVGLGKTHLMQAIGNRILKKSPQTNVKYVTSEAFTNDFIKSVHGGDKQSAAFRKEYRNADILLVDDIQFFANKLRTQEEFFHTFNDLYDQDKQIVLTSDRMPNEINKLQDRLVSRFAWGLSVDIMQPDLTTRIAILKSKAKFAHIQIPDDCVYYIAKKINTNVRELEGALRRVQATARFKKIPINLELVISVLNHLDVASPATQNVTIPEIIKKVSTYFNVSVEAIKGKKRIKEIVIPRQIAMYLARKITRDSLPKIGEAFGGKDHTTVIHAYDKIKADLKTNPDIHNSVADLKGELQS